LDCCIVYSTQNISIVLGSFQVVVCSHYMADQRQGVHSFHRFFTELNPRLIGLISIKQFQLSGRKVSLALNVTLHMMPVVIEPLICFRSWPFVSYLQHLSATKIWLKILSCCIKRESKTNEYKPGNEKMVVQRWS